MAMLNNQWVSAINPNQAPWFMVFLWFSYGVPHETAEVQLLAENSSNSTWQDRNEKKCALTPESKSFNMLYI